jgi:23S rRNA (cytosine1962-C5)-methyltransferase
MAQDAQVAHALPDYALLDVGDGRRLERFGPNVIDRPAPTAEGHVPRDPTAWSNPSARFDRLSGPAAGIDHEGWTTADGAPIDPWTITEGSLAYELRLAPSGQVGMFPEQAAGRAWIGRQVRRFDGGGGDRPAVLNLFGYTGAATIGAAAGGAGVTHVDASRPAVAWARRNAELNGLSEAPIRWITDDAIVFAGRELRRGHRYRGVVLDPPSYGHAGSRVWRLTEGLPDLLAACVALLEPGPAFILLSAHTPGFGPDRLGAILHEALEAELGDRTGGTIEVDDESLLAETGTRLHLGSMARWAR